MISAINVTWLVGYHARAEIQRERKTLHDHDYNDQRDALREYLCAYFNSEDGCLHNTRSISPIDGAPPGLKAFKVRWGRPGQGKSGGYRLVIVADCINHRVAVQSFIARREEPTDAEIEEAASRGVSVLKDVATE
jgi:hypothetical protein